MNEQRNDSKHKRSLHLLIATNYIVLINYANITSQRSTAPLVCLYGYACLQYASFARLADRHIAEDGSIYAHGPISYGVPGPKLIREIFEGIPHKIKEYEHVELDLSSSLADFSWKVSVASLEEARDGLMLDLPHQA